MYAQSFCMGVHWGTLDNLKECSDYPHPNEENRALLDSRRARRYWPKAHLRGTFSQLGQLKRTVLLGRPRMVHFPETMRCCQSSAVWAEPIGTALPVMVCRFTCQILVPYRRATENAGSPVVLLPLS